MCSIWCGWCIGELSLHNDLSDVIDDVISHVNCKVRPEVLTADASTRRLRSAGIVKSAGDPQSLTESEAAV